MKNHIGCNRGGIKNIFYVMFGIVFILFTFILVYTISLFVNDSSDKPDPPAIIERSAAQADAAAKITGLINLYKKSSRYFIKDEKLRKYFDLKNVESNLTTIENSLLSYFDIDSNSTLGVFLFDNRILFSENYSYFAECELACLIRAYANYKIEKGEHLKAIPAINSLLSLSLIAQKGNGGEKNISESFFIAADIKEMAYRTALKLIDSRPSLPAAQLDSLTSKLENYSFLYDDIFSLAEYEKKFVKKNIYEQFAELKSDSKAIWVGTNLEIDLMNIYYGNAVRQREKFFDDMAACKNLSYKEIKSKLGHFLDLQVNTHISPLAVINSDINPAALALTCQNLQFLIQKYIVSRLVVNAVIIRANIQKYVRGGAPAPATIDALSKIECLKKFPDILTDTFSGAPLKYSITSTGEIGIYSVGPDMTDDGGKFKNLSDGDMHGFDCPGFPLEEYDLKL